MHGELSLVLADACGSLTHICRKILSESILNVITNQDTCSVRVLRISNFRMMGHWLL